MTTNKGSEKKKKNWRHAKSGRTRDSNAIKPAT